MVARAKSVSRVLLRSVTVCHDCSYTIGRRMQRSIDRTIGRRPSRLIVHQSLIATTSRTISYDSSCHRHSPIVRDSATTRRDRLRYATTAGDRSKNCRSVAPFFYNTLCIHSCQNRDTEMLSTSNFYDGNVIYMVWKDK